MDRVNCDLLEETIKIIKHYNLKLKKRWGQSFLVDCNVLEKLVSYVNPCPSDTILEIGAGIGTVTRELAKRCKKVIAVEIDRNLVKVLNEVLKDFSNIELIESDVLSMRLPRVDKIFSNTPYSISSPLLIKLLKEREYNYAILTFQREFADRLVARPGTPNYGRLTVLVSILAHVELKDNVSRSSFFPQPEVDSRIVKVMPRREIPVKDLTLFEYFTSLLFSQRRRTLYSALKHVKPILVSLLSDERIKPLASKRIYQLEPEELLQLFETFKPFL